MAWDTDLSLFEVAQKLVDTRLRMERIRLAQRLQSLESRAVLFGVATKDIRAVRKSLQYTTPLLPDRVDRALVQPRKLAGVWRRRYLSVQSKPGSVF